MNMVAPQNSAWYRQPVMWLVVAVPLSAVLFGIVMITLAFNSDDGLVVDDYYKKGLEINRSLQRDQVAAQLGLSARLNADKQRGKVVVEMHWPVAEQPPRELKLVFLNATREGLDQKIVLRNTGGARYQAALPGLEPGRWYVQLSTARWRLQNVVVLPLNSELILSPVSTAKKQ